VILESSIGFVPTDGETTGRRIRINRPDDEKTRCKVSKAGSVRDFSLYPAAANNTFNVQRHLISATTHRAFGASSMQTWREVVGAS
jgi:hypothetical protein